MQHLIKILPFVYCLVFIACGKQAAVPVDTASLNLSFRATYGEETLILDNQQEYDYEGNSIKFSKVNFYLANLVAVNDDGETELSEIKFLDLSLTHKTPVDAAKGTIINFDKVPVGAYQYLNFGIGVPTDLNKTSPSDYSTSHPLGTNNRGEYREDWGSYIFAKIDGQYDKDGDGFGSNDIDFTYQMGGRDGLYQDFEFDLLTLNAGETINLDFELDIKRLLTRHAGSLIPIIDYDPNDQIEERIIIMNNFLQALQLK